MMVCSQSLPFWIERGHAELHTWTYVATLCAGVVLWWSRNASKQSRHPYVVSLVVGGLWANWMGGLVWAGLWELLYPLGYLAVFGISCLWLSPMVANIKQRRGLVWVSFVTTLVVHVLIQFGLPFGGWWDCGSIQPLYPVSPFEP